MEKPRFSLKFLFHLMTVVAVVSTLYLFVLRLPDNFQAGVFFLLVVSGFLFLGTAVSSLLLHPTGKLVTRLVLVAWLFTQAYSRYYEIKDVNGVFISWKGFVFTSLLIIAAILAWQGVRSHNNEKLS